MKRFLLVILLSVSMSTFSPIASANTPQEVLTPYLDFKNSFFLEDYQAAAQHAYLAWQNAEELIGDNRETYILARNYAYLSFNTELPTDRVTEAFSRSIELAETQKEKADLASALKIYSKKISGKKTNQDFLDEKKKREQNTRTRKSYSEPFFKPVYKSFGDIRPVKTTLD